MKRAKPTVLALADRAALVSLTYHQGFDVLKRLMESKVQFSLAQILLVAPDDTNRAQKISDLQAVAYARDSFCKELCEDLDWQRKQEESGNIAPEEEDVATQAFRKAAIAAGILEKPAETIGD